MMFQRAVELVKRPCACAVCGDITDAARNIHKSKDIAINCTRFDEKHLCSLRMTDAPIYTVTCTGFGVLVAIAAFERRRKLGQNNVAQKSKAIKVLLRN